MRKTILITGAGTGIGKDAAKRLAARGHKVYATTCADSEVPALQADLGSGAHAFKLDITAAEDRAQIVIRGMIARGGGTVIFMSSITGRVPEPFVMPYSMTKFAISAAAAGLREKMKLLDKGIHVSVVEPGPYNTGFNQKLESS